MMEFEHVTTNVSVQIYESAIGVFHALLEEVRELSKKKPDATLNKSKVHLINNLLVDLISILGEEPERKYLQILEDDGLPQVSDALMMMAQFNAALRAFRERYYKRVSTGPNSWDDFWITKELLEEWETDENENEEEND